MNVEQYYTAPPQKIFDEIKEAAIKLWNTYDDSYGYASGKISRIKDIKNIKDNAWYIVAMFDCNNQRKLCEMVGPETAEMIIDAINTGDDDEKYIPTHYASLMSEIKKEENCNE